MSTEQLELDIPQAEAQSPASTRAKQKSFVRNCDECHEEYTASSKLSRTCGPRCRTRAMRRIAKEQAQQPSQTMNESQEMSPTRDPVTTEKPDKAIRTKSIRPKFSGLPPDVSIGVMLLERELDRMEQMYTEERAKRKKIQDKYETLKDQVKDERHQQQLAGIEAAKPDLLDRVISGVSQLPAPILENLAPALGRLMEKVVPAGEGVAGQLQGHIDPMTGELLQWIANLPEAIRENLLLVIGKLMGLDQEKLNSTLVQFLNLIKSGSTLSGTADEVVNIQPTPPYDQTMYGFQ